MKIKERVKLQEKIVEDLYKEAHKNAFHFAEIKTGTGKTKILIETAKKLIREGTPVVISTSNNFLAEKYIDEARKFGINEENFIFLVGKDNYVSRDIAMSESFLHYFALSREEVSDWFERKKGRELISSFVADFGLNGDAEAVLARPDTAEDRTIREASLNIKENAKIFITNHFYLLHLMKHAKEGSLDDAVFLVDEVHLISNTARTIFQNSFSPFRLKYLLSEILATVPLSKAKTAQLRQLAKQTEILITSMIYAENKGEDGAGFKQYKKMLETYYQSGKIQEAKKALTALAKKENFHKSVTGALRELSELTSVAYAAANKNNVNFNVSFSQVKRMPSFSVQVENPILILRKILSLRDVCIIGVSGTIRSEVSDSVEANRWSFERLGLLPFKTPQSDEEKSFNARIKHISLKVYDSIFQKEQARYYIPDNSDLIPPTMDKDTPRKYVAWVKKHAQTLNETIWGNCLVLMSSYENIALMKESLLETELANEYEIIVDEPGISMATMVKRHIDNVNAGKKSLLMGGLNYFTGVDLSGDYLNTLYIGKLPIEPSNSYFRKQNFGNYSAQKDLRQNALITFRQGIGRPIRSEKDRALIVVADPRIRTQRYRMFLEFLDECAIAIE